MKTRYKCTMHGSTGYERVTEQLVLPWPSTRTAGLALGTTTLPPIHVKERHARPYTVLDNRGPCDRERKPSILLG